MARLCLYGKTPSDCPLYVRQEGKPAYLSSEQEVVVDTAEGKAVTICREKPLSSRWKALAALGIFLTAPIQAALQQDTPWEDKIPYDIQVTLTPRKDTACTIGVSKGAGKYQPPPGDGLRGWSGGSAGNLQALPGDFAPGLFCVYVPAAGHSGLGLGADGAAYVGEPQKRLNPGGRHSRGGEPGHSGGVPVRLEKGPPGAEGQPPCPGENPASGLSPGNRGCCRENT